MRIQPWMKAVTCAAMLMAAQTPCSGQTPFSGGAQIYGSPDTNYQGYPGGYGAVQGGIVPPYATGGSADPDPLFPAGTPENFQPWPEISPFNPANVSQTQTYNQQGLWFKQMLHRRRDFSFTVSGAMVQFRDAGHALIGSPFARRGNYGGNGLPEGVPADGTYAGMPLLVNFQPNVAGFYIINDQVFPYPLLTTTAGAYVQVSKDSYYPIFDASVMSNPEMAAGIQLETGYFNEDETGVRLTGWGAQEVTGSFQRGLDSVNGIPLNQTLVQFLGGGLLTPMNGNIPLDNGEPLPGAPDFGDGSTAKYDLLYQIRNSTSAAGTNLSIYRQPIYKNNGIMIRPLWGARYLHINEGFAFRGIDSGFNYNLTGVSTGTGSGGTGTGGTGTGTGTGTGSSSTSNGGIHAQTTTMVAAYDQYTATLSNSIQSNMAGPEAGIRFDLGNPRKGFTVWGESIFGMMVNNQRTHLNGNQIGDPLADVRFRGYSTPRMLENDSSFNQTSNSTRISPTFQQSIFADFDFIDVIPVLRQISILDNSSFRIGYTVLWVGGMSRPADSIKWQGYPLYPQIDSNHTSWWAQQVTASLNFKF